MLFRNVAEYYEKLEAISSRLEMIGLLAKMLKEVKREEIRQLIYITQGLLGPPFEGSKIGIAEKLAEEAVALATGFTKENVEQEFRKSGDLGSAAEAMVSKTRLRKIKKSDITVNEVFDTMLKIAKTSGEGSKDMKIRVLAGLLSTATPVEARYLVRFALGTLRLGLGDATILESLSIVAAGDRKQKAKLEAAYNLCSDLGKVAYAVADKGIAHIDKFSVTLFSPIRPALAERMNTAKEILEKMHGKASVESKYDGLRAQIHLDKKNKKVEIFSRNLERITEMFPDIANASLKEMDVTEVILEGEVLAYDEVSNEFHAFQETIQRKRKHGIEEKASELPVHLFAFDLMYLNGESYMEKSYEERRSALESIIKDNGLIKTADRIVVTEPKKLELYFDKAIENGLEGIVAKDLTAKYIAGARKFSWIKMKRSYRSELSDSLDLVIVGYYRGKGARAEFQFGGLLAAVYNDQRDMFETITRIGTGFTEDQMVLFQKTLEHIVTKVKPARVDAQITPDFWVTPKYVVTVRADEITRSPTHTCGRENIYGEEVGYALRFPRIIEELRKDKNPEDATTTKEITEMFKMQKKTRLEEK